MKRIIALLSCLAMALTMPLATKALAEESEVVKIGISAKIMNTYAEEVHRIVNQKRAAQGLAPLALNKGLSDYAMQRAVEQIVYFAHQRPDGRDINTVLESLGHGWEKT